MQAFDLTSLQLFVAVCELGNIVRAAERAHLVGSAVSKRLAQLEEQLGTPLLTRKRHGMVPTEAGYTVLEHARTMLDSAARLESDMRHFAAGARGHVRILASVSAMTESLADDVAAFLKAPGHHTIQVDMEERVSPEIVRGVREGLASIGVCWDAADVGPLQTLPYRCDRLSVVVPAAHRLAAAPSVRFADILDEEWVSLPVNSAVQVMLQRHAAALGRTLRHRVIVTNFEAALRVVRAGLAISLVPQEVVGVPDAAVRVLRLDEPWAQRRFILCYRDLQQLTPAARLLVDHLAGTASAPITPQGTDRMP